jgi:acetoacetyl-CoA reductase
VRRPVSRRLVADQRSARLVIAGRGSYGEANDASAKAGMHGLAQSLALEVASLRITVNTNNGG